MKSANCAEKRTFLSRKTRRTLFICLGLSWPIIHFLVFWVYVNIDTFALSFQRFSTMEGKYVWYGLNNFRELMQRLGGNPDKTFIRMTLNSFLFLPWNVLVLLPLSLVAAYVLYKKVWGMKIFRVIFFLPNIISVVVLTMMFLFSFDSSIGFVNKIFVALGMEKLLPTGGWFGNVHTAFPMILLYCLWAGIGYNVVLVTGAMVRVPQEVIESARLDGVRFWREFGSIILPMISPTVSTLIVTGSTAVLTLFLQPMLLTGGQPANSTYTIAYMINDMVRSQGRINMAATLGVFFSLIGVPLILFLKWGVGKLLPDVEY